MVAELKVRLLASVVVFAMTCPAAASERFYVKSDQLLEGLIREAIARRPELAQATLLVAAERERIPQAGAPPDPVLNLGIQNDSFTQYSIGKMETSWYTIMIEQTIPWPGKLILRRDVVRFDPTLAEARLQRVRFGVEAEVRRAYVGLILVRGQLRLLTKLEELWAKSEQIAKARYTVGEAPQSDLLRAQLERTRLTQQRWSLAANESARVLALNRECGRSLDEPIAVETTLEEIDGALLPTRAEAFADAEARSPELEQNRISVMQSQRRVDLARSEWFPDFAVGAGVMPRGALAPMWQLTLGISLPVYGAIKQKRAVTEADDRKQASSESEKALVQLLHLRTAERLLAMDVLARTNRLYRETLLVQSEATATSELAEYRVGKVPFSSVLEALTGYLADQFGYLESLAQAQRVAISQFELSLDEVPGASINVSGSSMTRAGAAGAASPTSVNAPDVTPSSPASGMGSM